MPAIAVLAALLLRLLAESLCAWSFRATPRAAPNPPPHQLPKSSCRPVRAVVFSIGKTGLPLQNGVRRSASGDIAFSSAFWWRTTGSGPTGKVDLVGHMQVFDSERRRHRARRRADDRLAHPVSARKIRLTKPKLRTAGVSRPPSRSPEPTGSSYDVTDQQTRQGAASERIVIPRWRQGCRTGRGALTIPQSGFLSHAGRRERRSGSLPIGPATPYGSVSMPSATNTANRIRSMLPMTSRSSRLKANSCTRRKTPPWTEARPIIRSPQSPECRARCNLSLRNQNHARRHLPALWCSLPRTMRVGKRRTAETKAEFRVE